MHTFSLRHALASKSCFQIRVCISRSSRPARVSRRYRLFTRLNNELVCVAGPLSELNYPMFLLAHRDLRKVPRVSAVSEFAQANCSRSLYGPLSVVVSLGRGPCEQGPLAQRSARSNPSRGSPNGRFWRKAAVHTQTAYLILLEGAPQAATATEERFCARSIGRAGKVSLSWELRTSTSLARLQHGQGRVAEARSLLQSVYDRFSEGFDTVDLKTAKTYLDSWR